ncbi:DUF2513 domain-containing protein [Rhodoblastus acidophilus]|uniref:DUF2513 domain-containing protein n=1 Tax=Candidatus Rhodoblastus alkanivorans TaxID=2954117 RepID=A0ABS9Z7W7_9HYPH|nr:DUF2513 domain-containing protein [Candidatus Rhodoblastus alkanivorans]MCI4678960.1 DUF2513 domain-containing protein [Candidatus Rhodoblastus alkanivorans]MCI4683738.1 DUF2513 domain-containing protein [Candidatus Rhodoblastus alkanivorans]MDI4641056.1 DUF2513 domain-containing protein [Rhodoblastus acidophilus]
MKRDMDLIREMLLNLESWPMERGAIVAIPPESPAFLAGGHSGHEIEYHLNLIKEAGFINCPAEAMTHLYFSGLTWQGHDFLDSIRDPEIWAKTKKGAAAAGGFTVDLLKDLAKGLVKKQIEEFTGVKL